AATAVVSAKVAALAEGVLKAMFLTKLKTMMAFVVMAGVVAVTVGALGTALWADPGPVAVADEDPPPQKKSRKERDKDKDQPKQDIKDKKITKPEGRAKAEETVLKSFTTKKTPRLVVETFNGAIEVTTADKGAVKAKVVKTVRAASEEAAKEDLKNVDVQM